MRLSCRVDEQRRIRGVPRRGDARVHAAAPSALTSERLTCQRRNLFDERAGERGLRKSTDRFARELRPRLAIAGVELGDLHLLRYALVRRIVVLANRLGLQLSDARLNVDEHRAEVFRQSGESVLAEYGTP